MTPTLQRLRRIALPKFTALAALAAAFPGGPAQAQPAIPPAPHYSDWPSIRSVFPRDDAMEARIASIVASMTLEQKVGQMTQPEIKSITPDQVRRFFIGSVLNGGGTWPGGRKHATPAQWVELADRYHEASMRTGMATPVPIVWGTDAVHGHSNVRGATLFPHNIGLGAAHEPALVQRIGESVGRAVRATGLRWTFAPTLAVARDDRWGRTYESFSEDPALVRAYAGAYVSGLQGDLSGPTHILATAKHFIGDGGTERGTDQGVNAASRLDMINLHGQGYFTALAAGVQTVMVSFNSWTNPAEGIREGKLHGSRELLTHVLKQKMGFDGFVVSDWNGIGQVPGCSDASCAQAINAGIDMVMVPEKWQAFIANTLAQVKAGEIPMSRIDDAVTRILRVKFRAGLFTAGKPSQSPGAGELARLQDRALAREAVRKSLVLLKNDGGVLPLQRGRRTLVVGKAADSIPLQAGGWSLTWQGTDNSNADFEGIGDSLLAGIREAAGPGHVTYSETGNGVSVADFDVVIVALAETPYAEGPGDLKDSLAYSAKYPDEAALLRKVSGQGKPVVTVFMSGRPMYANDLLNASSAFVAAWLPGTEGKGVADVLYRNAEGGAAHDFTGVLPFSWPALPCQTPLNDGDGQVPQFPLRHGLRYTSTTTVGPLPTPAVPRACEGGSSDHVVFQQAARAPYSLWAATAADEWKPAPVPADLAAVLAVPGLRVETTQLTTQQDAKRITWSSPGRFYARASAPQDLRDHAGGALEFDVLPERLPAAGVTLQMDCGTACRGSLDLTPTLAALPADRKSTVSVPLRCFAEAGAKLAAVDVPFAIESTGGLTLSIGHVRLRKAASAGAACPAKAAPGVTAPR